MLSDEDIDRIVKAMEARQKPKEETAPPLPPPIDHDLLPENNHGVREVRIAGARHVLACLCGWDSGVKASEAKARALWEKHLADRA